MRTVPSHPPSGVGQALRNGNPISVTSMSHLNPLRATSNGRSFGRNGPSISARWSMLCPPLLGTVSWKHGAPVSQMSTVSCGTSGSAIQCRTATCTKILARLTDPCVMKGGRGPINHRAVNQARVAGDTKGKRRGLTRRHDTPGHPETHQEIGFTSSSAQTTKKTMSGSRLVWQWPLASRPKIAKGLPARVNDGAPTSRPKPSVPAHLHASGVNGQKPCRTSLRLPHEQPPPPQRQLEPPAPPRTLGRLPHGKPNLRRCRAAE